MTAYKLETATSEAEVESWRDWWSSMPVGDVDSALDYFLTVARTDPAVVSPFALRITVPGLAPVLVVARLSRQRFRAKLFGAKLGSLRAPALVVSFGGVVGASQPAQYAAVAAALDRLLRSGVADVVVLQRTDRDSSWFAHLWEWTSPRDRLQRPAEPHWTADLPDSWEEFLARRSSKSRRQIRFDDRKLERRYGDRMCVRRLHEEGQADRVIGDVGAVAAASYQHALGVSLLDGGVHSALLELARERRWLRLWMLYVDEQPVAFWWGVVHGGVLTIGSPGYLPEFSRDRVGYYTLRRMLEDCSDDHSIRRIDFGVRDAEYKARFGDTRREVADVLVFARRPRAVLVHLFLRAQEWAVEVGRAGVRRSGRYRQVKSWWRARRLPAPVPVTGG